MTMTENFKAIQTILNIISDGATNHNEELFRKARKMSIDAFLSNKITESEFDSLIITIASIFSVLQGKEEGNEPGREKRVQAESICRKVRQQQNAVQP